MPHHYNRDVTKSPMPLLLQSALLAGGAIVGFCHAFRPEKSQSVPHAAPVTDLSGILRRLDTLEHARSSSTVSPLELAESLDRVSANFRREMDDRFGAQDRAIDSLSRMTAHTSELIERLLSRLEADEEIGEPLGASRKV